MQLLHMTALHSGEISDPCGPAAPAHPDGSSRYFKFYRMAALYHVVKSLETAPPSIRLGVNSLMLGAIVIYKINAVIYRPGDGKAEPYLLESCCQHIPGDTEGRSVPIMYARGLYFLSDLVREGDTYHLPDTRHVDLWVLEALYRREGMASIELEFNTAKIAPLSRKRRRGNGKSSLARITKKRQVLSPIYPSDNTDGEEEQRGLRNDEMWALSSKGSSDEDNDGQEEGEDEEEDEPRRYEIRVEGNELAVASGAEPVGYHAPSEGPCSDTQGAKTRRIHKTLAKIKRTFAKDVLSCAPRPKGQVVPWMLLSKTQQDSATLTVFSSPNFNKVLRQVQFRKLNEENWRAIAFQKYFPQQISEEHPRQNFTGADYYKAWMSILHVLDEEEIGEVTEEVYGWFKDLFWIPLPDSDRMWCTKRTKPGLLWTMVPESDARQLCPRIAINSVQWERGGVVPGSRHEARAAE